MSNWISKIKAKRNYIIGAVVLLLIILPTGLYIFSPLGKIGYSFFKYIPYPVAFVQGQSVISTKDLISDTQSLKNFYTSQDFSVAGMRVDFETTEGKLRLKIKEKDVLDKLVEDEIIKKLAKERNIEVSTQDAERELNKKISQLGDRQALELNLKQLYGWSMDDFRDKVVQNQLLVSKLSGYYFDNQKGDQESYAKVQKAKKELKADGSNFSEIAQKYSDGESAKNGGELGWFSQEQMVPEVSEVAFSSKVGAVSDVIQSSLGYHIILVQEFRQGAINENQPDNSNVLGNQSTAKPKEVKISQIFVKGGGFLDWLKQEKKKANVQVLMRDYTWNANEGKIVFRDEALNKAEQTLRAKSQGDPSMQLQ